MPLVVFPARWVIFTLLGAWGGDHAALRRVGQAADRQRRGAGVAPEVRHNPVFGSPSE